MHAEGQSEPVEVPLGFVGHAIREFALTAANRNWPIAADWVQDSGIADRESAVMRAGIYSPSPVFLDGDGSGDGYDYGYGDGSGSGDGDGG